MTFILGQNKRIIGFALATAGILLVPLAAMQFTEEVNWSPLDFAFAGVLLFGAGLTFDLAARMRGNTAYRAAAGLALGAALLLVWTNGAVGLIGSADNPANLLYGGVLAIGIIGAGIARFRPRGMARALFATALAQASVTMIGLIIWKPQVASPELFREAFPGVLGALVVNACFVLLFAGSALLFRRAARRPN